MQLYDWQAQALQGLPKNVILTWDTGTGKTIAALSHAMPDLPILIVAPPAKVNSGDWQQLASELGLDQYIPPISFGKVAKANPPAEPYILIVDEVHYAKSATSQRAKAIIRLATSPNCKQFIGLSATAIPNGYIDLQTYGIIFGWWKHKTEFLSKYVLIDRSRGYPRIIGYRNEDTLKRLWNSVAFGLDKSHLNLPELINITSTITLSKQQRDTYNMLRNQRITPDGEILDTPSKLHATLRQYLAKPRQQALEAILDDTEENILIFYNYNVEREAILETLSRYKRKIWEQSGHRSELLKDTASKGNVTLLQYSSGSAGLNLQHSPITVFYSPSYSYQDMHQAKGRNHRAGQDKIVRHYHFRVAKTVDEAVYKCLEAKTDFNERIISDEDMFD